MAVGENEKLESLKLESRKLESFCLSLKEPSEIGKNRLSNFSGWSPARAFQFQLELSNFAANFSTSARTFQLRSFQCHFGLSNFSFFPTALPNYTYPIRALSMSLTHVGDSLCWCYVLHVGHRFSHLKSHQFCLQHIQNWPLVRLYRHKFSLVVQAVVVSVTILNFGTHSSPKIPVCRTFSNTGSHFDDF